MGDKKMNYAKKLKQNCGNLFAKYAIYLVLVFMIVLSTILTDNFMNALQAFQYNGIAYLMKPIEEEELRATVERIRDMKGSSTQPDVNAAMLRDLLANLRQSGCYLSRAFPDSLQGRVRGRQCQGGEPHLL